MLIVALTGLGLLGLRSATREMQRSGRRVAHERAQLAARAALALTVARLRPLANGARDDQLAGHRPQSPRCTDPCRDCVPRRAEIIVPASVAGRTCTAPPCLRPGAVAMLPDQDGGPVAWCNVPLRELLATGDVDARVTAWVRNDDAEGLDRPDGWRDDEDGRLVITAMAEVRGVWALVREEVRL